MASSRSDNDPAPQPAGGAAAAEDPFSRFDYRRVIAWPQRIEREAPFLLDLFEPAPVRRLLDLGCGTGEHSRFLVDQGFEVAGVDRSPGMIERARDTPVPAGLRFIEADLTDLEPVLDGRFGGAICLGNVLPHMPDEAALERFFGSLRRHLADGAPFCLQLLNYELVFAGGQRSLPVNVRPGKADGEEIAFLRLMTPQAGGRVLFNPTTLRYRPGAEPPVTVERTKNVLLRGWRRGDLEPLLTAAGFADLEFFGGMTRQPWLALESADLVIVAR